MLEKTLLTFIPTQWKHLISNIPFVTNIPMDGLYLMSFLLSFSDFSSCAMVLAVVNMKYWHTKIKQKKAGKIY
jgi:hypothetical protein